MRDTVSERSGARKRETRQARLLDDLERWATTYTMSPSDAIDLADVADDAEVNEEGDLDIGVTNFRNATSVRELEVLNRWADDPPPMKPCWVSDRHRHFWRRPTGGWLCTRCYPPHPAVQVEVWEVAEGGIRQPKMDAEKPQRKASHRQVSVEIPAEPVTEIF